MRLRFSDDSDDEEFDDEDWEDDKDLEEDEQQSLLLIIFYGIVDYFCYLFFVLYFKHDLFVVLMVQVEYNAFLRVMHLKEHQLALSTKMC